MAFARKNLKRRRSISSDSDKYKLENAHGGVDRLSLLQDDFLISILSFLPLHDAARTSVLSRRFGNLWKQLPVLSFSTRDIATRPRDLAKPIPSPSTIFLPIISAIKNHDPSVPLLRLHLQRSLIPDDDINRRIFTEVDGIIVSLLAKALSLGLRHLTLDCSSNRIISLLPTIFNLSCLESLSLPSPLYCVVPYILRTTLNLPRLKTLSMSLDYINCSKHNELFAKLTSLQNLHLQVNCFGSFSLFSQSIRHLNLKVCTKHGVKLNLPALESLRLESADPCISIPLFQAKLPTLKKCVLSLDELYVGDESTVVMLLCCLSHAEELHLVLTECLIEQKPYHVLLDPDKDFPVFSHLKHLEVTACFHELNCKDVITLLHNSPALRSLKLCHKAICCNTEDRIVRNCWRSKLPRNSSGNYRYGCFTDLHLEDNKEKLVKLLNRKLST